LFSWSSPSSALARALAYKYSSSLPLLSTQLGHRQNVLSRRARGERVPGRGRRRGAARGLPGWLAARGRLVRCGGRLGCGHLFGLSLPPHPLFCPFISTCSSSGWFLRSTISMLHFVQTLHTQANPNQNQRLDRSLINYKRAFSSLGVTNAYYFAALSFYCRQEDVRTQTCICMCVCVFLFASICGHGV
jgi:hypothetical protein